jgi:hypothetical protein
MLLIPAHLLWTLCGKQIDHLFFSPISERDVQKRRAYTTHCASRTGLTELAIDGLSTFKEKEILK